MEPGIERAFGHQLFLSGPLIDQYLENIGHCIMRKLSQKHLTGYTTPFKEFMPPQIFNIMQRLFVVYGCDLIGCTTSWC